MITASGAISHSAVQRTEQASSSSKSWPGALATEEVEDTNPQHGELPSEASEDEDHLIVSLLESTWMPRRRLQMWYAV